MEYLVVPQILDISLLSIFFLTLTQRKTWLEGTKTFGPFTLEEERWIYHLQ